MEVSTNVEMLLRSVQSEMDHLNKELKHMPRGTLVITTNGPARISYLNQQRSGTRYSYKGIGSNPELVQQLARKAYLKVYRQQLEQLERQLLDLRRTALSFSLDKLRLSLPKHFERIPDEWLLGAGAAGIMLHPVLDGSVEVEPIKTVFSGTSPDEWMRTPYCANTSYLEDLIHRTGLGFSCRSKSEVSIAGLYEELGLPFHYDEKLAIGMAFISPDFRGIRRDRNFVYHEHWGLRSDSYVRRNLQKLWDYASEGIVLGRNLLITCDDEGGGLNLPLIRAQIKDIYLL